jgi:maltose-binding protein MalE
MAPNWQRKLMVGLVAVVLMAACTSADGETTTSLDGTTPTTLTGDPGTSTSQAVQDTTLLVWADETRAPVVEAAAALFETDSGIAVEVEVMPFLEIRGAALDAVPTGQGPDLFIDSNEGTGALVEAGIIAPLDLAGREADFVSVAIDAFSYGGQMYGLPFVTESVGLFYNKDLVPVPPADFEALRAACDGLGFPTADGLPCLAIPVGEPLHQFPFVGGFGGYVFGFENGAFDVTDVGIDSPEAIAGATFLNDLYREGYADGAVDYSIMADLFNQGAVPFMWTGPWQVESVDAAGINYGVAPLPLMAGNDPRPFVGSQGFFLNAVSENSDTAVSFLLEYIATTPTMVQLAAITARPPALLSALGDAGVNPNLLAFAESASGGLPLPNIPDMDTAWAPLAEAFNALSQPGADPSSIMTNSGGLVRAAVGAG